MNLLGKKTYIVSALTVLWGVYGLVSGMIPVETAVPLILGALGLSTMRQAIATK